MNSLLSRYCANTLVGFSLCLGSPFTLLSQAPNSPSGPLHLNAALVLSPELCAKKVKKGGGAFTGKEIFDVGAAACRQLEPGMKPAFDSLTRVDSVESAGSAQVILLPEFVESSATRPAFILSSQKMILLIQWTVKDSGGHTLWIQTVEGAATGHGGGTHNSYLKRLVEDVMKNSAEQAVASMTAAPELRALSK